MLELPECIVISQQINEVVKGKTIKNVSTPSEPSRFAFYFGDPALYHERLINKICAEARAVGGMIEWEIEDMIALFGDGINVRYFAPGKEVPKKNHLHIELDDSSSIVCTVQMYGGMWVFKNGENDSPYYIAAKEKPSPLSDEFDKAYFDEMLKSSKSTLSSKAFLATEQRIPGLGNGVLQDILFNAGLHPKTKINAISEAQAEKLFNSVKRTLFDIVKNGGRDTEKDLLGSYGGYKTILSKKTVKMLCPVCGHSIKKQAYMGGNIYFCSNCQPQESTT